MQATKDKDGALVEGNATETPDHRRRVDLRPQPQIARPQLEAGRHQPAELTAPGEGDGKPEREQETAPCPIFICGRSVAADRAAAEAAAPHAPARRRLPLPPTDATPSAEGAALRIVALCRHTNRRRTPGVGAGRRDRAEAAPETRAAAASRSTRRSIFMACGRTRRTRRSAASSRRARRAATAPCWSSPARGSKSSTAIPTTIIERGVLRTMLPIWLNSPELKPLVIRLGPVGAGPWRRGRLVCAAAEAGYNDPARRQDAGAARGARRDAQADGVGAQRVERLSECARARQARQADLDPAAAHHPLFQRHLGRGRGAAAARRTLRSAGRDRHRAASAPKPPSSPTAWRATSAG